MNVPAKSIPVTLVKYDAMCHAIAQAVAVDEVKDIRDKVVALETYARIANNVDAERQAQRIRVRAEIRVGELLREQPKRNGGDAMKARSSKITEVNDDAPPSLADLGITKNQSSQWQQAAEVPKDVVEEVLADTSEPITTHRVIQIYRVKQEAAGLAPPAPAKEPVKPVNTTSIALWGELKHTVERLHQIDFQEALDNAPDYLFTDIVKFGRELYDQLNEIGEAYERAQRNRGKG